MTFTKVILCMKLIVMKKHSNNYSKHSEECVTNVHPIVIHNLDCPNIYPSQIVNIALAEDQIPVSHTNEPDWEVLAFPKEFSTYQFHFNFKRGNQLLCREISIPN